MSGIVYQPNESTGEQPRTYSESEVAALRTLVQQAVDAGARLNLLLGRLSNLHEWYWDGRTITSEARNELRAFLTAAAAQGFAPKEPRT